MPFNTELGRGALIALFGGVGGLLAWLLPFLFGVTTSLSNSFLMAGGNMLAGAVTAFAALHLTDFFDAIKLKQCLAFALLIGIAWDPVLATLGKSVQKYNFISMTNSLSEKNKKLEKSADQIKPEDINSTADSAASLANSLPKIDFLNDKSVRDSAEKQIANSLEAIKTAGANNPIAAAEAIRKVGMAGTSVGSDIVSRAASRALDNLAENASNVEVKSYISRVSAGIGGFSADQ